MFLCVLFSPGVVWRLRRDTPLSRSNIQRGGRAMSAGEGITLPLTFFTWIFFGIVLLSTFNICTGGLAWPEYPLEADSESPPPIMFVTGITASCGVGILREAWHSYSFWKLDQGKVAPLQLLWTGTFKSMLLEDFLVGLGWEWGGLFWPDAGSQGLNGWNKMISLFW